MGSIFVSEGQHIMTDAISTTLTQRPAAPRGSAPTEGPAIRSDFDTFLQMLTTQLQNQDPMNPMDSSEFAVQLATFSGVEQQMKTNSLLEGLAERLDVMGLSDLAGWIGKQARADMPVNFTGQPTEVGLLAEPLAASAELVVRDATGAIVARTPVDPGATEHLWTGRTTDGTFLPAGRYALSVDSFSESGLLSTAPVEAYGSVLEVRKGPDGPMLVFAGGIEVPAGKVTALSADPARLATSGGAP